jgi:hypothetical protein
MVKIKRENTLKTGVKQAVQRQHSGPAKIKAETGYELSDTQMTAFGGLLALVKFLDLINFKELFEKHYCSPSRKPELGNYRMVLGFLMLLFIGFARIGHFGFIRQDPMVCGIMGVTILPAISTFWRYLTSLCLNQSKALLTIGAHMRRRVWATCGINYDCVCIDVDTTVSTVYGEIEGSRKGHNTKHRGKKGLRPVFLFIEETREYLCGTQRRGSTMTDAEMAKLIRQIGDYLPPCVKKVIIKGDAEFIGGQTVQACIECGFDFIFGNKRCTPVFKGKGWYRWGDYDYNESMHQPTGWYAECRFVAMRIRKDQMGDRQLEMFPDDEYSYRVFATNISWRPHAVIKRYDKRASVESLIKEAQQEGILAIPSRRFLSNHAFFQIIMLAYNIWRWIKLVAGVRPGMDQSATESSTSAPGIAPGEQIVNQTIRLARLKMLFIAAKIVSHERQTTVKYSAHDARAAGLLDFLAYLDKRRKETKAWEIEAAATAYGKTG